jgi:hypothetical protein
MTSALILEASSYTARPRIYHPWIDTTIIAVSLRYCQSENSNCEIPQREVAVYLQNFDATANQRGTNRVVVGPAVLILHFVGIVIVCIY